MFHRGIQHYVFMTVIKQLEEIANAYLAVLAEGGIQLVLEGEQQWRFFILFPFILFPFFLFPFIPLIPLISLISFHSHYFPYFPFLSSFPGDELDKIIKSVIVRSADGKYRERGLSQLSGGQWRRVSMALDFAFAEIIRRKGESLDYHVK